MNNVENVVVLIPAFNPDDKLITFANEIIKSGFIHVVIVDDGSNQEFKWVFNKVAQINGCCVLVHAINLGKGRALKTGFHYLLDNYGDSVGVITADADGQHNIKSLIKVSNELICSPNKLILGARNFSNLNIPFRSKLGNVFTRKLFSFFSGIKVNDTQTGLRGIPYDFICKFMNINGERYEYEMNMLFECKKQNIPIHEIVIDTIYIEDNQSSHFNPLVDSIKIYSIFLKYISSSLLSFLIDILLFSIFTKILGKLMPEYFIIVSTVWARAISSFFNYKINKNTVFKKKSFGKVTFFKYYILCIVQMFISGIIVSTACSILKSPDVIVKIVVDSILFIASYEMQKEWVFKENGRFKRILHWKEL